jgi:2-amino-4-hydroxy-6-hydroxymethyldihydropteridine diphosphokinase
LTVTTEKTAYLALGSNVGNRERTVLRALRSLARAGLTVGRCSSLYETDPAEGVGGGRFINAVVEVRSLLCPGDLLNRLKSIENSLGRTGGHNRPREIDIDIISVGDLVLDTADLVLPHPRYSGRAFVLLPLKEIAPRFRCPRTGRSIDQLTGALTETQTVELASNRGVVLADSP